MSEARPPESEPASPLWWQTGIVYQVYPRSFQDSNADGIGDLPGVVSRLPYLEWLGVDAVWLSPIFPSPMADFGYDIADYENVDPRFGSLADLDLLVREAHARGMKVLLDFVPNHSSDEHAWFVESRSSRDNPKRDWYVWRDPAPDGGPPNNWTSYFGGPAWTLDSATGQYYLHLFHEKQPDLNWRNPAVKAAMFDALRFWMKRGIDGFRVDVIWLLAKDEQYRDNPANPDWKEGDPPAGNQLRVHSEDLPEVHDIIREMRAVLNEFPERVMIGEVYLPFPKLVRYYGEALDGAHLPFNFHLILLDEWKAPALRDLVETYEAALPAGAWPNWVLGNHDQSRIASRIGRERARLAQMLLLCLRGTPTCYYGDEIGMQDVLVPPELTQDPQGKFSYPHSRDPERSPMQWEAAPQAGFSTAQPWLPVGEDYESVNVEAQRAESRSTLCLFRRLAWLRRERAALAYGTYRSLHPRPGDHGEPLSTTRDRVFAFARETGREHLAVLLNFSCDRVTVDLSDLGAHGRVLLSSELDREGGLPLANVELRPYEGLIVETV